MADGSADGGYVTRVDERGAYVDLFGVTIGGHAADDGAAGLLLAEEGAAELQVGDELDRLVICGLDAVSGRRLLRIVRSEGGEDSADGGEDSAEDGLLPAAGGWGSERTPQLMPLPPPPWAKGPVRSALGALSGSHFLGAAVVLRWYISGASLELHWCSVGASFVFDWCDIDRGSAW